MSCLLIGGGPVEVIEPSLQLDGGQLVLQSGFALFVYDALPDLPDECTSEPTAGVGAVAVATVEEHWARNDHGDEWGPAREAVLDLSDEDDPFDALVALFAATNDPAFALRTPDDRSWLGGQGLTTDEVLTDARNAGLTRETTLLDGLGTAGLLPDGRGYLALGPLAVDGRDQSEVLADLNQELDTLLLSFREIPELVLDLRAARGGSPTMAMAIAGRFVDEDVEVGDLEVRADDGFVASGRLVAEPVPFPPYDGPLVVVIGPGTVGAGEIVARSLDGVATLVGGTTAGSPAPVMARSLPNGWTMAVPNQRLIVSGEVAGAIQPDVVTDDPLG